MRTYSVHRSGPADILSVDDAHEASTTTALLPVPPLRLIAMAASALLRHPMAVGGALTAGLRRGVGGRGTLWQFFYFVEALLLRRHCRRDDVRHLHVHFANNAADIARTTVDLGQRMDGPGSWSWSFTMHGPTEFEDPARFDLAHKVEDAAFVACISHYCRGELGARVEPARRPELVLVRCGLDLSCFPVVARSPVGEPLRILCVGRLVEEKGQDVLVAAVGDLVARGVPVALVLVGEGPHRPVIEAAVREHGLAEVVTLTGSVGQDEILAWYRWADVFALLSYAEGLPVVLMEAMATGLPVVTTRIAGIPELVEDGTSGFVVTPGDAVEAAAAFRRLAEDPAYATAVGANARKAVEVQHDIDGCVVPLQDALERRGRR